jgi:ubiquinone/menaquinone biosynthesis C-methylase UbiE
LHLPFPDATFDRVICSEVLEHIPGDLEAMSELARVLRPGGTMAITVPRFLPELVNWALSDEYHNVPGGHIRIYRRSVLEERLTSVGLRVLGHHYAHGLHSPYWWLKCLVGTTNEENWWVKNYHRLLVWDIMKAPRITRVAEALLAPVIGKSIIVYVVKP